MIKQILDFIISLGALIILSPILIYIAFRIKSEDGGSVFYRGERVGMQGELFNIYKFRTMIRNADQMGGSSTADDDVRITKIGHLLRKHKIDELPQLINVLKGEMSLVGPRPQVKWAVDLYSTEEREILTVKPGLTDDASLRFANEGEILKGSQDPDKDYMQKIHPGKIRLSLHYVRNRSLLGDFVIIFQTMVLIFKKWENKQ